MVNTHSKKKKCTKTHLIPRVRTSVGAQTTITLVAQLAHLESRRKRKRKRKIRKRMRKTKLKQKEKEEKEGEKEKENEEEEKVEEVEEVEGVEEGEERAEEEERKKKKKKKKKKKRTRRKDVKQQRCLPTLLARASRCQSGPRSLQLPFLPRFLTRASVL